MSIKQKFNEIEKELQKNLKQTSASVAAMVMSGAVENVAAVAQQGKAFADLTTELSSIRNRYSSILGSVTTVQPAGKRGPGRPRKTEVEAVAPVKSRRPRKPKGINLVEVTEASTEIAPKRGRGRPRKSEAVVEAVVTKPRRGRPKKNVDASTEVVAKTPRAKRTKSSAVKQDKRSNATPGSFTSGEEMEGHLLRAFNELGEAAFYDATRKMRDLLDADGLLKPADEQHTGKTPRMRYVTIAGSRKAPMIEHGLIEQIEGTNHFQLTEKGKAQVEQLQTVSA